MAKNYYTIKKAQQEEEDVLALLLGTIADLDSLVTEVVFSQGKIPPEIGDEVNKRVEVAKAKGKIPPEIGDEINKRVEVAKAKIIKVHGMVSSLSFQKMLSKKNA
jgi:hypothetical protein